MFDLPAASLSGAERLLFVWDYDRTIVLDDTDVAAVRAVAPDLLCWLDDRARVRAHGWLGVVNACLSTAAARGMTATDVARGAARAELPDATARALRRIDATAVAASAVVSDSNTAYIGASLRRHALLDVFQAGIFANVATLEHDGAVRIRGYCEATRQPHDCGRCDARLCKGAVVRTLRARVETAPDGTRRAVRVAYVGDGGNDFCPVSALRASDVVLCRAGYPLERRINAHGVAAQPRAWATPDELERLVDELVVEAEAQAADEAAGTKAGLGNPSGG